MLSPVDDPARVNTAPRLDFINDRMGELRKSEAKVANFVTANPEEVVHYSISELAEGAGVSEPTVIRFCRRVGYRGYQDFKIALAQSVVPRIKNIHEAVVEGDDARTLAQKIFQATIATLQDSLSMIDYDVLQRAIDVCSEARTISFFGLGGSASVAMDAVHKFFRLGIPCRWYDDTHMQVMQASLLGPEDVVVAITHSGSSKDIIEAIELANEVGATTIAITSHMKSPVSKVASLVFSVSSSETAYRFEPMSSRIAQLSVIDAVAVGVALNREAFYADAVRKTRRALVRKRY